MINVVAAIIKKNDTYLCARRKSGSHLAGFWEFPGGKVEANETHSEALQRELIEELHIDVGVEDFVGQSTYDYGGKIVRLFAYLCDWHSGEITLNDHDSIEWLPLDRMQVLKWAPADIPLIFQLSTYMYYTDSAQSYSDETISHEMNGKYDRFIESVVPQGTVMDLGCGSGRDSIYFKKEGFEVTAIDPVSSMAKVAAKNIGAPVEIKSSYILDGLGQFDGIWACASLLHCPKSEIVFALESILERLKYDGVAYLSVKKGEGEGLDEKGRFFSYFEENELLGILDQTSMPITHEIWQDLSELRGQQQAWINILIRKIKDD